ncbi:MAG: phosphatidate cytidylyltransferase [Lasallia pustulata]|uniref:Phosphatidate cytidylyltransferase n=1 Tax=Lasallia pustulata TaxID=136370 RepID=A0A5M8PZV2_9LECA|nr:MAG: phosphatidate cytidylyltransferase [Lasallia pustulata]
MSQQYQIPGTPRVISPTPTPSETTEAYPTGRDSYFAPITRSAAAKRATSPQPIDEGIEDDGEALDPSLARARARSRSPIPLAARRRSSGHLPKSSIATSRASKSKSIPTSPPTSNGHLSPSSASSSFWRDFSRSPSPLGLIPIHRHWRSFVHRHEIPRKALHVSIGFFTVHLYARGIQTYQIHPYLLSALIPVALTDYLRHTYPAVNRLYVRCLGALMRESEVNEKYNGVIWYLLGAWAVLRFLPKDVAVMAILLLSWCDTAASTIGRLYGRYTPRIRKGKSLAGSAAAAVVGLLTAGFFWGWVVPRYWGFEDSFMFKGELALPSAIKGAIGWKDGQGTIGGWVALGVVGLWSGFVASASEVVDIFGWDDNVTIPVLSGLGLWGFFKLFT